jgi:hypothetical protein
MLSRRNVFPAALAALLGVTAPALAATKTSSATPFDTDNDGTVDIDEAKKAAGELFDKLDTDKDGTLDVKELKGIHCGRSRQRRDIEQGRVPCRGRKAI